MYCLLYNNFCITVKTTVGGTDWYDLLMLCSLHILKIDCVRCKQHWYIVLIHQNERWVSHLLYHMGFLNVGRPLWGAAGGTWDLSWSWDAPLLGSLQAEYKFQTVGLHQLGGRGSEAGRAAWTSWTRRGRRNTPGGTWRGVANWPESLPIGQVCWMTVRECAGGGGGAEREIVLRSVHAE